ncbi:hypothetical protein [Rhodoplanes sp. Z2-YC6860]|uniref:hypothetical protein n=1 Tax=Rhodoplanes sp. Z2-YC6860 TaxID=674703 RepID=UPI0012ECE1A1|nr:hypothetical protein [Rhodoplanes sp. Z2-YC6860]
MSTVRFSLVAVGLFMLAFIGISWANKGFPVMVTRVVPLKPDARIPTFEESVKQGLRKDWENSKTAQSDGDKERDKLRLELLQASIGYKLSPCDATMRKNLVEALTRYVNAWAAMAGCKFGRCTGSEKQLDAAAAAFQSPADIHVHATLTEAINKGGISKADFPKSIRDDVFMFSGVPFTFGEENTCAGGRRAENSR